MLFFSYLPVKFIGIDFCQPEQTPECTRLQLIVKRDNGTGLPGRCHLREPHVTTCSTGYRKAEIIA
jgi:hypothetical protein